MSSESIFVGRKGVDPSFKAATLIMPSVSIGNVGQIAVDAMINTFNTENPDSPMEIVGYLDSDHATPVAGHDALGDATGKLSLSMEVFQSKAAKVTFLQIRAPIMKGHNEAFLLELSKWVRDAEFAETIVLSGADAAARVDAQLAAGPGPTVRFAGTTAWSSAKGVETGMPVPPLELFEASEDTGGFGLVAGGTGLTVPLEDGDEDDVEEVAGDGESKAADSGRPSKEASEIALKTCGSLISAGIAPQLFRRFESDGIPAALLVSFVHEGVNVRDGINLMGACEMYAHVLRGPDSAAKGDLKVIPPASWGLAFGGRAAS